MLVRDFNFSLLGDKLVKLDRHSMANSLEVRLLDRDLVDFSFNFPGKKVGFLDSKLILKDAYKNNLPSGIETSWALKYH